MTNRQTISTHTQWETRLSYSRAVRVGNLVEVAGTTAIDEHGNIVGSDDAYEQARFILRKIERALNDAGATRQQVVRTRMYVTNIRDWQEVGRAHGEFFREINPAATLVAVAALVDNQLLVEIEATAIIE